MAALAERERYEAALARTLGRLLRQQYQMVVNALGSDPKPEKVTSELLDIMRDELAEAIQPLMEQVYLAQVEALETQPLQTKQGGLGIDWKLVNERAARWAREYTFGLVGQIVDATRTMLREQIANFWRDEQTIADLKESLAGLFGPVRAEMIAVTEVTRAASQGEQAFAEELRGMGLKTVLIWQTANDDLTCPICAPLHGTRQGDGWTDPPPAHPRCRCWINTVVDRG